MHAASLGCPIEAFAYVLLVWSGSENGSTELQFIRVRPDDAEARRCVARYREELGARFPAGFSPTGNACAADAELSDPVGTFLLVGFGARALGCGGVRTLSPGLGEIKQMWVDPSLRGQGAGRRLLVALEAAAGDLGHRRVRLDTSRHLGAARRLYLASGYREIPDYNQNPYADHWFEKDL